MLLPLPGRVPRLGHVVNPQIFVVVECTLYGVSTLGWHFCSIDISWCSPASILKKANPPDTVRLPQHTHRRIDLCGTPKSGGNRAPIPRARIIDAYSRGT